MPDKLKPIQTVHNIRDLIFKVNPIWDPVPDYFLKLFDPREFAKLQLKKQLQMHELQLKMNELHSEAIRIQGESIRASLEMLGR